MLYNIEGLVIRTNDYGEGHKILTLFTREMGKVSVMARGAKKLKSRFSAIAQLFTYAQFVFYRSSGQMGNLNQGDIIASHHAIREDLHKAAYSAYLMEMIDRTLEEKEVSPILFDQLKSALDAIEDNKDPQIVVHIMELKVLSHSGYNPQLEQCVFCGSELRGALFFSSTAGGVICSSCRGKDPYAQVLAESVWKLLRLLARTDMRRLGKTEVKRETKLGLKKTLDAYMEAHMGTGSWKAKNFLKQMEKYDL